MGFFKDPKQKAAWDKELASLKQEKGARRSGNYAAASHLSAEKNSMLNDGPLRERISYAQLLREENIKTTVTSKPDSAFEKKKEVSLEK